MVDIKKFSDKDLYGLFEIDISAVEADVNNFTKKTFFGEN